MLWLPINFAERDTDDNLTEPSAGVWLVIGDDTLNVLVSQRE